MVPIIGTPLGRCGGPFSLKLVRVLTPCVTKRKRKHQLHQRGNGTLRNGLGSKLARMLTPGCETERNAHFSYSSGAMEECLRRFKSPAAHVGSAVGMDLAGSDRHGSALNKDAATLPNWVTSLISILGTSNGALWWALQFETGARAHSLRDETKTQASVTPAGPWTVT